MIRLLAGAALSAVVLFVWGFVFWAASGVMYQFLSPLPDEGEVAEALQKRNLESGTYLIPFPARGADAQARADFRDRSIRGPLVEIVYHKEGVDPADPQPYVAGFCQFLAASLVAGVLLILAQPGLRPYPARVLFVALLGVFASVAVAFSKPVWFHHPWPAALYESAYVVVGWLLAGLAMAAVIRPAKPAAPKPAQPAPAPEVKSAATPSWEVRISPPAAPPSP